MTEHAAVVEVTYTARKRIDELGAGASAAVEDLRSELERTPGLGRRVRVLADGAEIWVTRIEPRSGLPGLTVTYVQVPEPPPPTAAIVSVVPDDGVAEQD